MARPIPCRRISATSKFLAVKFYIRTTRYMMSSKIDYVTLNDTLIINYLDICADYLYENPERENPQIKGAFKPLLDRINTDNLIKTAYLNDDKTFGQMALWKK